MALIFTNIDTKNVPEWVLRHGIREFLSNARDAVVEHGATLSVEWRASKVSPHGGRLHIENEGCVMDRSALRVGHTSKDDRDDMIGHFGHGFKEGCVVCVRHNRGVIIRTGSEVWRPTIAHSADFGGAVLAFQIQTGRKPERRVAIEVDMSSEEWKEMKEDFLPFARKTDGDRIETSSGTLLTAPRFVGRLYVKGNFVCSNPGLSYGYDFKDALTDRERKMVVDPQKFTKTILTEASIAHPELFDDFYRMIVKGAEDVRGIGEYDGDTIEPAVRQMVCAQFKVKHGEDAVPVDSDYEAKEFAALGKKGVVVPAALRGIFAAEFGDTYSLKRKLREETLATIPITDLDESERRNLVRAAALLAAVATDFDGSIVDVVDFRDRKREGMVKDGRVLLARSVLGDSRRSLAVLVREVARTLWTDQGLSHETVVERVFTGIVEFLGHEVKDSQEKAA